MTWKIRDSFAGVGGWDIAVRSIFGVEALGIEIMPEACATREAAGLRTMQRDIRDINPREEPFHVDVSSPPCQTFSISGNGSGRRALSALLAVLDSVAGGAPLPTPQEMRRVVSDERTALVLEPLRFAVSGRSPLLAWEQVPSVLPLWRACGVILEKYGYSVWSGVLNAEEYGTPQTRRRAVLIARSDGKRAHPPVQTHARFRSGDNPPTLPRYVSMAEALASVSEVPTGWIQRSNYSAPPTEHSTAAQDRGRGSRRLDEPSMTLTSRRMHWSPDAAARIHPDARTITVRESGVLQGFPSDWPFRGNTVSQYLQMGNAIPVPLAKAILKTFLN